MLRTSELSVRQMCDLYKSGQPTGKIAKQAGISVAGVRYHLNNQKVKMRPKGSVPYSAATPNTRKKRQISIERMRDLYTTQGKSIAEISKIAKVSSFAVNKDLRRAGVTLRPRGGKPGPRKVQTTIKISLAAKYQPAVLRLVEVLGGHKV